ncbi:MAG: hypothetical protein ACP5T4_02285 [Candidatus Micrarchaeia archaeon]
MENAEGEMTKLILKKGFVEVRVNISGIFQKVTFKVEKEKSGGIEYTTLHTDKLVGISDLAKIAAETGLPAESPTGKVFPKGKSAKDFQNLQV